jgi:DNA-binding GntR family transcriptional regulator
VALKNEALGHALATGGSRTLSGTIANDLRRRILSGDLGDGAFLRQDLLAKEYDISRIPVREALGQLAAEGLVVNIPHRGVMIPVLSAEEALDLYETRAVLEPHLMREAIPKMDFEALRKIKTALGELDVAMSSGALDHWGELNATFHYLMYEPAGRPLALSIVQGLLNKSDRYAKINRVITGETSRAQEEHTELYSLCAKGSADEAAVLLRNHLNKTGRSLWSVLDARQSR